MPTVHAWVFLFSRRFTEARNGEWDLRIDGGNGSGLFRVTASYAADGGPARPRVELLGIHL
ncbi:MAG: hypothetical protein V4858_28645 [Pseudomonadota bacterium]